MEQKIDLRRFLLNLPHVTERSQCFFSAAAHFVMGSAQVDISAEVSACQSSEEARTGVMFSFFIHYFLILHRIPQIRKQIWEAPGVRFPPLATVAVAKTNKCDYLSAQRRKTVINRRKIHFYRRSLRTSACACACIISYSRKWGHIFHWNLQMEVFMRRPRPHSCLS